jgi:hypothetical protein
MSRNATTTIICSWLTATLIGPIRYTSWSVVGAEILIYVQALMREIKSGDRGAAASVLLVYHIRRAANTLPLATTKVHKADVMTPPSAIVLGASARASSVIVEASEGAAVFATTGGRGGMVAIGGGPQNAMIA